MRGKPKYDYDDIVKFEIKENDEIITLTGSIYIKAGEKTHYFSGGMIAR